MLLIKFFLQIILKFIYKIIVIIYIIKYILFIKVIMIFNKERKLKSYISLKSNDIKR